MDYGFRAYDIYCIQKKIYFSSVDYNALMEIDLKKNICSCIQVFNKENYDQKNLHSHIICHDNILYFIPYKGKGISSYNIMTGEAGFIDLTRNFNYVEYSAILKYENNYIIIPNNQKYPFLLWNITDNNFYDMKNINNIIERHFKHKKFNIDMYGAILEENRLYITFIGTSQIGVFDLDNNTVKWLYFEDYKLANLTYSNPYIWISTMTGDIISININNYNNKKYYKLLDSDTREFFRCVEIDGNIFALPCMNNNIWYYSKQNNEWKSLEYYMPEKFNRIVPEKALIMSCCQYNDRVYFFPRAGSGIICKEKTKAKMEVIPISPDKECTRTLEKISYKKLDDIVKSGDVIEESKFINCERFVSFLIESCGK